MEYVINLSESFWSHSYQYEHLEGILELPVLVLGLPHQDRQWSGVAVEVHADCPLGADAEWTEMTKMSHAISCHQDSLECNV